MGYRILALIAALSCVAPAAWADRDSDHSSAIVTESGLLTGTVNATGTVNEYLGIPYATPPVGALRWTPPQPFGKWTGVFAAIAPGHNCTQEGGGQEDCLYLNVFTPASKKGKGDDEGEGDGHAVMVWIHGGGLTQGAGKEFDPTPLVEGGPVIVVTLNYRLGLLGFLAHPALDHEGHLAGNYGLMDQQLALEWVKRNIAAFGGNPHRVTVFGESAGGLSVYSQLASPLAAGLFERAIAQSGAYASFADYLDHIVPIATAETVSTPAVESGIAVANSLGCASQTAACLRSVPASAVIGLRPRAIFPFIDGTLLRQTLRSAFASGDFNHVPVMTGTNHDEYRYFVATNFDLGPTGPLANDCSATVTTCYRTALAGTFGSLTLPELGSVLAVYPVPPSGLPADAGSLMLGAAGTDGTFACTARHAMQALASHVTVYAYEFNDPNAPPPLGYSGVSFPMGAYHGGDVQYLFNKGGVPAPFTAEQAKLSQAMIAYWTRFAKEGHPNSPGQPHWAPYDPATDMRQSFVPPTPGVESGFAADHMCALWDSF
jgi:para-nitrobenzyl esterase